MDDETEDENDLSFNEFLKFMEWMKRRSTPKKGIRQPSNTDYTDYTEHYSDVSDTPRPASVIRGK